MTSLEIPTQAEPDPLLARLCEEGADETALRIARPYCEVDETAMRQARLANLLDLEAMQKLADMRAVQDRL